MRALKWDTFKVSGTNFKTGCKVCGSIRTIYERMPPKKTTERTTITERTTPERTTKERTTKERTTTNDRTNQARSASRPPPGKLTLDKSTYASMVAMFRAKRGPNDEVEAVFSDSRDLSRTTVLRLLMYMRRSFPGARSVDVSNTLDVSRSRGAHGGGMAIVRTTVQGDAAILAALEDGKWDTPATIVIIKDRVRPAVTVRDYRLRLNLKEETPMSNDERASELRGLSMVPGKTFRLKRRFGFLVEGDFRVDVTGVRQVITGAAVPTFAKLQSCKETYEVEIEYLGSDTSTEGVAEAAVKTLMHHHSILLKVIDDTDVLMTPDQRMDVLHEYAALVSTPTASPLEPQEGGGGNNKDGGRKIPFIGPKPATLEMSHLLPLDKASMAGSNVSVRQGYTVTDKADGERRLLFIAADRRTYTINDRLEVRAIGQQTRARASCVLDGEWTMGRFLAFDAYFLDGRDVRELPLMSLQDTKHAKDRLTAAAAIIADFQAEAAGVVELKEFRAIRGDNDVFTQAAYFLLKQTARNFAYEIDGLIFTPAASPVPRGRGADTSWPEVLKWKPPHHNTIDFLVRMRPTEEFVVRNGQVHAVADLKVGYDPDKFEPITAMAFLTGQADSRFAPGKRPGSGYIEKPFTVPGADPKLHVCYLPRNDDGSMRCANGDDIVDGSVIEFSYVSGDATKTAASGFHWHPTRVRHDKTEKFATTGVVTANNYLTALNVWRTIECPVTEAIITGKAPTVTCASDPSSSKYYANKMRPDEGDSTVMRRFHNWLKKDFLLLRAGRAIGGRSIFDFGVGRGGDLRGWVEMGAQRVMGIDSDPGGITDPVDGAHVRVLKWRTKMRNKGPRVVFLPLDAAVPLGGEKMLASFSDINDRAVAQMLWGIARPDAALPALRPYHRFAALGGFDVATCMFAIHYFFDSAERLDALCANVAAVLRPGGIFVGVCLDGRLVQDALAASSDGKTIQGHSDDGLRLRWSIERKFDEPMSPIASYDNVGRQVDVYMESIGHIVPEYLMDYFLLVKAMAKHRMLVVSESETTTMGFGKASTGLFRDVFQAEKQQALYPMSDSEKQYSFMNRWFMFRKADADTVPLVVSKSR